jgi:hypothetical protein
MDSWHISPAAGLSAGGQALEQTTRMQVARPHSDPPVIHPSLCHSHNREAAHDNNDSQQQQQQQRSISNQQPTKSSKSSNQTPSSACISHRHRPAAKAVRQTLPGGPDYSCIVPTALASRTLVRIAAKLPLFGLQSILTEPRSRAAGRQRQGGQASRQVSRQTDRQRPGGQEGVGSGTLGSRLEWAFRPVCSSVSACEAQNVAWDSACSL